MYVHVGIGTFHASRVNSKISSRSCKNQVIHVSRTGDHESRITKNLRAIVRENRAVPKDWGQPISFIFSEFKTQLIRLILVTLRRFPGVSLPRLSTPVVFGQGKP